MIESKIKATVRDVADFPKPGIIFKDITPLLKNADLCREITLSLQQQVKDLKIDVVAGIESRGFLFGMSLANLMGLPFIPIRKSGKLPYATVSQEYDLEYGSAKLELHTDALKSGQRILIHDDLLATGGTVVAASKLIEKLGGSVAGYSFIIELGFLDGRKLLDQSITPVFSLAAY